MKSKRDLVFLNELRFEDIIDEVNVQIKNIGKQYTDFKSGIKLSGGGSKVRNIDLLFKKHYPDIPIDFIKIKNVIYKENFEDKREYATLLGLLAWPIFNIEDKSSSLKIKDFNGIKKSISSIWKGIFE